MTVLALLAVLLVALAFGIRQSIKALSPVPEKLGVFYGQLKPCPDFPNCVSSQAKQPKNKIAPILFTGVDRQIAHDLLMEIISTMPSANVLVNRVDYVHVEFQSKWWGIRDDTEFALDDSKGWMEVRSAARLGEDDNGANRERVEDIRKQFDAKLTSLLQGQKGS